MFNVTATQPTAAGFVTMFPDDLCHIPFASNVNFGPGQTVPNQVVSRLSRPVDCANLDIPGAIVLYNRFGYVHLIVDVFGYFTDSSEYDKYVTVQDDSASISVDVPIEWNDIDGTTAFPPEPHVSVSPDIDDYYNTWDVPGISVAASRSLATEYATPAAFLASEDFSWLTDDGNCDTTDSGPYDDGVFVGEFVSAQGCGLGNADYFHAVAQEAGTDYYVIIDYQTITPIDASAIDRIIASIEVTPWP